MSAENRKIISWIINEQGTLACITERGDSVPSGLDIIKAQYDRDSIRRPSDDLPQIQFSRTILNARLIINTVKTRENLHISGKIHLSNSLSKTSIFTQSLIKDHYIDSKVWHPIIPEDVEDINVILSHCGISDLTRIFLSSYLKIRRIPGFESVIEFTDNDGIEDDEDGPDRPALKNFKATLYQYQTTGFNWLSRISKENFGCILADEMGLGKTIQVIALIHNELNNNENPSLIVCPSSLLINWHREFKRFSPSTKAYIHSGSQRTGFPDVLRNYDVIISSYDVVVRDLSLIEQIDWDFLVCDEAQAIKNPISKRSQYVKKISSRVCIAVTGTPFENRLLDVWSIVDLIARDLLGDMESFLTEFPDSVQSAKKLEPLISPLMLRRRVTEVAKDLPERIDIPLPIPMDERLTDYYEQFRNDILAKYGKSASLVSVQLLRIFCCEPSMALKDGIDYDNMNNKYHRLQEILLEIYMSGEKAIIFTSFHRVADKIVTGIKNDLKCYVNWIDGRIEIGERQLIIDAYTEIIGPAFLVLNPKAAGTGLNITAANHVIHYNLEWNPAVEDQASARAYRRGQTKPVFIYRLFYIDTIDEYIDLRVEQKRKISEKSVIGIDGETEQIDEFYNALQYTPKTLE